MVPLSYRRRPSNGRYMSFIIMELRVVGRSQDQRHVGIFFIYFPRFPFSSILALHLRDVFWINYFASERLNVVS